MNSLRMVAINLKQQTHTINFYVPFILSFIIFLWTTEPIKKTVIENEYNINSFFVVFISSNPLIVLVLFLGLILLFYRMPFRDRHQPFLLIRSGKTNWIISQLLYILIIAVVYPLIMIIFLWLITSSEIYFDTSSWGKIIYSLCDNIISDNLTSMEINKFIVSRMSPSTAFIYFVLIFFLLGYMIGCIQLFFNLLTHKYLGNLIAMFMLFLFLFSQFASGVVVTWISPISWIDFYALQISDILYPPFEYTLIASCLIDAVLTIGCFGLCRKQSKVNLL